MAKASSDSHQRVITLVDRGQADQDAFVARLSPQEREARGEQYAWSAKDQIAHNNFWRRDVVVRLQAALDGTTPDDTEGDVQRYNDRTFFEHRDTPWEELVNETARLRDQTIALLERFSAEELSDRDRYQWQGGSLQGLILVNWYDHPAEHWEEVYLKRGEIDRALEQRRSVADTVAELFGRDSTTYSFMVYKLGSMAARNGRTEQAVAAIREALDVNPSLIEQVRKDRDLETLLVTLRVQ